MSKESAKKFARDFYEDDELIKKLYKMGVLKPAGSYDKDTTGEEQQIKTVEAAKELGYDFTIEEFQEANKEYGQSQGLFKMIKNIRHLGKVVKQADKENK